MLRKVVLKTLLARSCISICTARRNDFILVHEIATKPVGYDESKLIEVVHGPSDSRMVLRLRLASETLYNAWLTGLQALYSVAQARFRSRKVKLFAFA